MKSIKELKELPRRKWDEEKSYESLYVIPSGKKHDSGFSLMYVIGCDEDNNKEIACACDDIIWDVSKVTDEYSFRTDMYYRPHVIHFWSREYKYEVGASLSSTTIKVIPK